MADTQLPEGTDRIIDDAIGAGSGGDLYESSAKSDVTTPSTSESSLPSIGGMRDAIKDGTEKLKTTANDRAIGFVNQGIERSSEALSSVSELIGDTASSIDERLGSQYGDYARQASQAISRAADSLSSKEPDELVEDARNLVRKSPGIALAGAAVLGFALIRVIKSGLETNSGPSKSSDRSV